MDDAGKVKTEDMQTERKLTEGNITGALLRFAAPMILGNMLQQAYSLTDTFIVGRFVGADALAAVGGTYTLTTFLYSVIIGLCMGSGALVSYYFGRGETDRMRSALRTAFVTIGAAAVVLNVLMLLLSLPVLTILRIPDEILPLTDDYFRIILTGMLPVFLYNFFAYMLRAKGNSVVPLGFLVVSTVMNIVLDILFVLPLGRGVNGAALATVLSQYVSGIGIMLYAFRKEPDMRIRPADLRPEAGEIREVLRMSGMSSVQQSVMNFGILMIQSLVNSFGTVIMAAFTVAVKIDTLAYMPAQEFGNAYSLFISQNFGAGKEKRISEGTKKAVLLSGGFCLAVSLAVVILAGPLMSLFVDASEMEIIREGVRYLRIEGSCYIGIGLLFLLYGYFRGINRPEISLLLTVISLGTRVALGYLLAPIPQIGVIGIWAAIPIGWGLADLAGFALMSHIRITQEEEYPV